MELSCVERAVEKGDTQRVGLSLCPLSEGVDLNPCVYRGTKKTRHQHLAPLATDFIV